MIAGKTAYCKQYRRYVRGAPFKAALAMLLLACAAPGWTQDQSPTQPAPVPQAQLGTNVETGPTAAQQAYSRERQTQQQWQQAPLAPAKGATPKSSVGGPSAKKGGATLAPVQVIRSQSTGVRSIAPGTFEPLLDNPVVYKEVPDVGEPLQFLSPEGTVTIADFLDSLARSTKWTIVPSQGLEGMVLRFFSPNALRPREALEILKSADIYYEYVPDTKMLYVMTRQEYLDREHGALNKAEFAVKHADVADIESVFGALLSSKGRIVSDPRTSTVFVWDTQENIKVMREMLAKLDVPLESQVFKLKYVDAQSLQDSLANMLTERGVAQIDPRTNALIVKDLPARQQQIAEMVRTADQKLETRTWTLNYAEPDMVAERLANVIPEELLKITVDEQAHQVSVMATEDRLAEIEEIIAAWDVKPRQVHIEAFLVSAGTNVARNLGIDWSYFDRINESLVGVRSGANTPDLSNLPERGLTVGALPSPVYGIDIATGRTLTDLNGNPVIDHLRGNRIGAVLEYLDTKDDLTILSRPRVTVQDGEKASFENTEERPYQEGGYSEYAPGAESDFRYRVIPMRVQFVIVGTILTVQPRINDEGNILMKIEAEDSSADNVTVTLGDQISTIPQKRQNLVETSVLVHNSQTLVIGGLRSSSVEDKADKVPVLGDLPFVGRLFKSTNKDHRDRELMIFITPTIVDEFTAPEAERLADFEESMSEKLRRSDKSLFGRLEDRLWNGENEIGVSIGQGGEIHSKGEKKTLEDLRKEFFGVTLSESRTVVIRAHPNAPKEIVQEVSEAAMAADLKVEYDNRRLPFVPVDRADD